jgi:hypothetical protein
MLDLFLCVCCVLIRSSASGSLLLLFVTSHLNRFISDGLSLIALVPWKWIHISRRQSTSAKPILHTLYYINAGYRISFPSRNIRHIRGPRVVSLLPSAFFFLSMYRCCLDIVYSGGYKEEEYCRVVRYFLRHSRLESLSMANFGLISTHRSFHFDYFYSIIKWHWSIVESLSQSFFSCR